MISQKPNYETAKKRLNPEQKKAVETLEGPVLAIAGPGTGKTEVLSLKVAEILKKQSDVSVENILCLTYTNAGVTAMRKRLLEFIGPEAHKVQIHTFHSFCNRVIQENISYFGVREAENISELEQFEIIEKILDSLSTKHLLFHKSSYHSVKDLRDLFIVMKQENWIPEDVKNAAQEYLADLPLREEFQYKRKYKEFQKGDRNQKLVKEEEEKMNRLLSGVELFPKYQEEMKKRAVYDYNDMILWVVKSFEKNEAILAKYQEQFLYILVDEFQDTNGSQKRIIDLLCRYWDDPNIFVVGDDDQSIYRFQGANMRNIMEFYHQYSSPPVDTQNHPASQREKLNVISIEKNYRSSQKILDVAGHIIEKNTERLVTEIQGITKHLTAENPQYKDSPFEPLLIEYYNTYHQELGIIKKLKSLQEKGIPLSNAAVIYQNHRQVENILKICEQEKIPVRVGQAQNILELPLIEQIFELLEYFSEESRKPFSREDILFQSLFFSFFEIEPSDATLLALWRRKDTYGRTFKTALQNSRILEEIEYLKYPEKLENMGKAMSALEQDFVNLPFLHFLESIFEKTGILQYVLTHSEKSFLLRAISTLFHFAKEESQKNHNFSAKDLLEKISRMKTHGISLPIQKILYEKEGAHFITAHSSKGLEFEYVFLMGVEKNIWDIKRKNNGFSFPDTLTLSNEGNFLEEKRRLFFVALTRAKKFLEVSYCAKNEEGKELNPSIFISELSEKILPQKKEYADEEIAEYQMRLLQSEKTKKTDFIQKEMLEPILENYQLSATHLNTYMECPLTFYFESLLQIPAAMNVHAAFGTAIHSALEKAYRQAETEGFFTSDCFLVPSFEKAFTKFRFVLSKSEFEKFLRHGKEILPQYYQKYLAKKEGINVLCEHQIYTEISGVPVLGNLDRIDLLGGGTIRITDYKTGNPTQPHTKEKMKPPLETNNQLGGDYWRQVVFYGLLVEESPSKKWILQEAVIDFVEPAKDGSFFQKSYAITREEKEEVKQQIKRVYEGIMNMDFSGCRKEECKWCNRIRV